MNKVRSTIQGMILTAFFLMLSNSAHAVFQAGVHWGTGFSGGMNGCMADTKAYNRLNADQKEGAASIEIATTEINAIKREIRSLEKKIDKATDRRGGNSVSAIFQDPELKAIILERAKDQKLGSINVGADGAIEGVDVEDKELNAYKFHEGYSSCNFPKDPNQRKAIAEASDIFNDDSFEQGDDDNYSYTGAEEVSNSVVVKCLNKALGTNKDTMPIGQNLDPDKYEAVEVCVSDEISKYAPIPAGVDAKDYIKTCDPSTGLKFAELCKIAKRKKEVRTHDNWDLAECSEDLEKYFNDLSDINYMQDVYDEFKDDGGILDQAKENLKESVKDSEGDVCIDCATQGYARSQEGPSTTDVVIGALAGLTGQYLGLRAYKSAQNKAIDAAAQLGHTMNPTPNFNLYSGLGLSAISAISGIASGAYLCAGAGPYGGVHGMNNPYAMQMAMMGQGGAFGYPFGQAMGNPMMGMYMPGGFGQMGPMGLHTPWHMMGNMNPALMGIMNPYASMMGPMSQFNPMAALGPFGMMGMPGAHMGMQGSFNPYGMMSPYAMMSPFGGLSATAGMGPFAMNPWQMMNPGLLGGAGGMGGLMSCIQAPCPGQMFNPYGMGMGTGGIGGFGGLGGLGGIGGVGGIGGLGAGGIQQQQQWLQMQMQMLQQQQQQQMAYYQQVQQDTQRRMAAAQQLTQLQQQMQQLNMQAAQIASQAGVGGIGGIGGIGGVGSVGVGIGFPNIIGGGGFGFGVGAGFGGGMQYGFPYGLGQFSPNTPTSPRGNGR